MNPLPCLVSVFAFIAIYGCARPAPTPTVASAASVQTRIGDDPGFAPFLERTLRDVRVPGDRREQQRMRELLTRFYDVHGRSPAWIAPGGPLPGARVLMDALNNASDHGLEPEDYQVSELSPRLHDFDPREHHALEVALCQAGLRYVDHLVHGRVPPARVDGRLKIKPRQVDVAEMLAQGVLSGSVNQALAKAVPSHPGYEHLFRMQRTYRNIASQGGWPTVPSMNLREGMTGEATAIHALELRLAAEGLVSSPGDASGGDTASKQERIYHEHLASAVAKFQALHGIAPDGMVGPETLRELNVSAAQRVQQIALNMERWRWVPEVLGGRYLRVNIAGFHLETVNSGQPVERMAVVVGQPGRWSTPVFSANIQRMILNPFWHVPTSIVAAEILPKVKEDPEFLQRNHFEVTTDWKEDAPVVDATHVDWHDVNASTYHFRQTPGPHNNLGVIKFELDSTNSIYLHDTHSPQLFSAVDRDLSHGCIRVERPMDLAMFIAGDQQTWNPQRLARVLDSRERTVLELDQPVPVHVLYFTVEQSPTGHAQFHEDVYGLDAALEKALASRQDR